jgi:multidrug resistance efflux pump
MPETSRPLPILRTDLTVRPSPTRGQHVVKDPTTGAFFEMGDQELFLLGALDGRQSFDDIRRSYEKLFGDPISSRELDEFVAMAAAKRLLQQSARPASTSRSDATKSKSSSGKRRSSRSSESSDRGSSKSGKSSKSKRRLKGGLLSTRVKLFDPDALLNRLEPRLRFVWTSGFVTAALVAIVLAAGLLWSGRQQLIATLTGAMWWETLTVAVITIVVTALLHEMSHGLTCKHFGGEVHEIGFFQTFFIPCFYCNVTEAWSFQKKSQRLWVTLAGGFCDLCLWSFAVFGWRLTVTGTMINFVSSVVLTVCGGRILFNLNPLLKMDGYYLLSDWLEISNLRSRSKKYFTAHLRHWLWGADRPAVEPRGGTLLAFGAATWLFAIGYVSLMLLGMYFVFNDQYRWLGIGVVVWLGTIIMPRLLRGLASKDLHEMLAKRPKRSLVWGIGIAAVALLLTIGHMPFRAGGSFHLRAVTRFELRAPVAGFLREVQFDGGERVTSGGLIARLEIPDLDARIANNSAGTRESEAKLRLLEIGTRPDEIEQQRLRVERAGEWRNLAQASLKNQRQALVEELSRLDKKIEQTQAAASFAQESFVRAGLLFKQRILPEENFREIELKTTVAQAELAQALSEKRSREAVGVQPHEDELARREKELAEEHGKLTLLEAGSRPEQIEAQQAELSRLVEEGRYLVLMKDRTRLLSPVSGVLTTSRLREKLGQHFKEGELICQIEEPAVLEAEIALPEQDVAEIREQQHVELKLRAFPYRSFSGEVVRVAPATQRHEEVVAAGKHEANSTTAGDQPSDTQNIFIVYVRLQDHDDLLRPGMSGYGRIYCGNWSVGGVLGHHLVRLLRTEYWW